jgi:uncharacterized protein (DUF433 family)
MRFSISIAKFKLIFHKYKPGSVVKEGVAPTVASLAFPFVAHRTLWYLLKMVDNRNLANRITLDPQQCGGRPCIRGMRIRVSDVLDLLASGLTNEQVVQELPDLELDDVRASIYYAARKVNLQETT